jgi:hypothetical protein
VNNAEKILIYSRVSSKLALNESAELTAPGFGQTPWVRNIELLAGVQRVFVGSRGESYDNVLVETVVDCKAEAIPHIGP